MKRERKKTWEEKVVETKNCISRARTNGNFTLNFYKNLFFLDPKLEKHFKDTDWDKQHIALDKGIDHLIGFFDKEDTHHHGNLSRIAETHSYKNLNIHPQSYYYWIEAMVMTLRESDHNWYKDLEHYSRECLFFPVSFIISNYFR